MGLKSRGYGIETYEQSAYILAQIKGFQQYNNWDYLFTTR